VATKVELQAEYENLTKLHRALLEESVQLQGSSDGAALQDHNRKLKAYTKALDCYLIERTHHRSQG